MQQRVRLTPEQIAEEAKPGWRVAPALKAAADSPRVKPDAVLPEVSTLMNKYFGTPEAEPAADAAADSHEEDESALVLMEPKQAQDLRTGRKAVFVANGKVVGEQG